MASKEILLPYQQRWVTDLASFKVWEKSRRIGASWVEAMDAVSLAAEGRGNYYYMSYNRDMTRGFIADCKSWIGAFDQTSVAGETLQDDPYKDSLVYELRFPTGNVIQALSGSGSNFRSKGKPGDVVGIDEAAFVEDLDEILKAAKAVLVWGGKVRIWSTHNGDGNPFNTLVSDIRSGRLDYSLHRTTLDEALDEGLYRRICEVRDVVWSQDDQDAWRGSLLRMYGDGADEELLVRPRRSGGAWLAAPLIERCCSGSCRVERWQAPARDFYMWDAGARRREMHAWLASLDISPAAGNVREHIGVDFARSGTGDLSVFAVCSVEQDLTRKFHTVIELRDCPFDQQRQLLEHLVNNTRFQGVALDAVGNGQYLAEQAQQLVGTTRAAAIPITEAWYRANMPPLKAAFEDGAIAIPADADIVGDLRSISLVRGVPRVPDTRRVALDGGKRHGDAAVAIALAYASTRRDHCWSAADFNVVSKRVATATRNSYRRGM